MDLKKMIEEYIQGRLAFGGCLLRIIAAFIFPVIVWQMIEQFLKSLDITWPMYLMIALLLISFFVGLAVYKGSKKNPRLNVAVVLASSSLAFTIATVMVFIYYSYHSVFMGILYSILTLMSWWITFRTFFPRKKKQENN